MVFGVCRRQNSPSLSVDISTICEAICDENAFSASVGGGALSTPKTSHMRGVMVQMELRVWAKSLSVKGQFSDQFLRIPRLSRRQCSR